MDLTLRFMRLTAQRGTECVSSLRCRYVIPSACTVVLGCLLVPPELPYYGEQGKADGLDFEPRNNTGMEVHYSFVWLR